MAPPIKSEYETTNQYRNGKLFIGRNGCSSENGIDHSMYERERTEISHKDSPIAERIPIGIAAPHSRLDLSEGIERRLAVINATAMSLRNIQIIPAFICRDQLDVA